MFVLFWRGNEDCDSLKLGEKFIYKVEFGNEFWNLYVLYIWKIYGRMLIRKYINFFNMVFGWVINSDFLMIKCVLFIISVILLVVLLFWIFFGKIWVIILFCCFWIMGGEWVFFCNECFILFFVEVFCGFEWFFIRCFEKFWGGMFRGM